MQLNIEIPVEELVAEMDRHYLQQVVRLAQARLDAMDARLRELELTPQEGAYVQAGRVIEAIRSVRVRFNISLGDAKRVVDMYRATLADQEEQKVLAAIQAGGTPEIHD